MKAGIARTGRASLAMLTALAMVLSVMFVLTNPAQGQEGNPPSVECASDLWNGEFWKVQVNDGALGQVETNVPGAITLASNGTWTNNHTKEVFRIVLKTGTPFPDFVHEPPVNPIDLTVQGLSHVTFCFTNTTTTTIPETTTTTEVEETTTTTEVEETTTTTEVEETTTTTEVEETTTTTIEDEVLGTTVTTQPAETTTSIEDEVLAEEVLPFTGPENAGLAVIAAVLTALGLLVTLSARRIEE